MFLRGTSARRRPQGFVDPCIPTLATKPPVGPQWIHEIKHDGYRLIACRHGDRVRLFTRRGYDWAERYPQIREAMLALAQDATIDGEAVVCDAMGVANFELLHGREHGRLAFLYAFDLLELDGVDLRPFPLERRKDLLRKLLLGCMTGIYFSEHLEDDGPRSSPMPAGLAARASSAKTAHVPTNLGQARPGSRSKTRRRLACAGSRIVVDARQWSLAPHLPPC